MKNCFATTAALVFGLALSSSTASAQQPYNMNFDHWSKQKGEWRMYEENAPASHRVWDSANKGTSILGINCTQPEKEHVAVPGDGKAAVRMRSQKVAWAFAAGNLYTGYFVKTINMSGAEIMMGTPFKGRPKALTGYLHYIPKPIDFVKSSTKAWKGKMDQGAIDVVLADWDGPFRTNTEEGRFIDTKNDPAIIATGTLVLTKDTGGYIRFTLPLEYKNGRTPTIVMISATSSRLESGLAGGEGSTLYLDELSFVY